MLLISRMGSMVWLFNLRNCFCRSGLHRCDPGTGLLVRFLFFIGRGFICFLWFIVHLKRSSLWDTGSLALGATLAVVTLMTGQWLINPLIAIIPVSEAASVVIQILYFKITHGKRFFKMAPCFITISVDGLERDPVSFKGFGWSAFYAQC